MHRVCLQSRLERVPFVKDVHPERQLTLSLLAAGDAAGAAAAEGALSTAHVAPCDVAGSGTDATPGEQQQQQQCVSKRPGRMTTRPTFSLEDNQEEAAGAELAAGQRVANDTFTGGSGRVGASRRRRALLQAGGHTLASILGADSLWAQGFTGQGVRMGVFDTGIRGDHPDVKHIE